MTEALKKELGQVFTPSNIAELMASFFQDRTYREILDPAAGKGALLDACHNILRGRKKLKAVEIDNDLIEELSNKQFDVLCMNFFDYKQKVDGIIMNPPYIRQELLTSENSKSNLLEKLEFKNINSKSNLYLYFLVKSLETLRKDGRVVAIVPNTWLTSAYGLTVQKHILDNYSLMKVINFEKNVFEGIDVDASIFVIDNKKPRKTSITQFYYFEDVEIKDITTLAQAKIQKDILQNKILTAGWFFYKENIPFKFGNLASLSNFASINRGITTNYNNFFIKDKDNKYVKEFPHLFKKIVNKLNEIKNFRVDVNHLNKVVLIAPKELNKLPQDIVSDIKRTEETIQEAGIPKTLYNMIQKKQEWFSLRTPVKDSLIFNYIIRNDVRFILNDSSAIVKDNFYQITFYEKEHQLVYLAILNSSFSRYFIENAGRSYGSGLLKIQKYELDSLPILDYRYLSSNDLSVLVSKAKMLLEDNSKILIKEIDEVLAKYYLEKRYSNMDEFYIYLDKQIVGRLNK